jgi:hypothetical protein
MIFLNTQREESTMNDSTARNLTRVKYAATLLGAMAAFSLAPAIAHAQPVGNGADGGCHYTDKDGYDIPIDDGQSVLVDGKTVTCSGGTITVSLAPKAGGAVLHQQPGGGVLAPVAETPKRPLLNQNVAVFSQQR